MAGTELVIDEAYLADLKSLFGLSNNHSDYGIETKINDYISKMKEVKQVAIMEGSVAEALDAFISSAEGLKGISTEINDEIRELIDYYLTEIDEQDEYLF